MVTIAMTSGSLDAAVAKAADSLSRHPATVGACHYCAGPLYENAPIVRYPDETIAHVACEIDARRQGRGRG